MKIDASQAISLDFVVVVMLIEIGADLSMWGPPLAGRVHVDIKVAKFDINFGADSGHENEASIEEFFHLVLQASSQQAKSQAAEEKQQNADWVVRGRSFSFVVGCKMVVQDAKLIDEKDEVVNSVSSKGPPIYARPMHLKETMAKSEMKIEIVQDGLWAKYDESQDPTKSSQGNNIDDLLDNTSGSLKLMMGVLMQGPPAIISEDTLKAFNILDQGERVLKAEKPFSETESPEEDWNPSKPKDGAEQWNDVHSKWSSPKWNEDADGRSDVQQTFVDSWFETFGWGKALSGLGKLPKLLGERLGDLYIEASLITI
ncbi:hypothetical protein F52700_5151 [Fusarium sp. NRRL 52700]|nr:hypothetical protein F52700_5151 [Fusarium sp. NRRL 52700]